MDTEFRNELADPLQILVVNLVPKNKEPFTWKHANIVLICCVDCFEVLKERHKVWSPKIQMCGKKIYSWVSPKLPLLAAHSLVLGPFRGEHLMPPAQAVCHNVD